MPVHVVFENVTHEDPIRGRPVIPQVRDDVHTFARAAVDADVTGIPQEPLRIRRAAAPVLHRLAHTVEPGHAAGVGNVILPIPDGPQIARPDTGHIARVTHAAS